MNHRDTGAQRSHSAIRCLVLGVGRWAQGLGTEHPIRNARWPLRPITISVVVCVAVSLWLIGAVAWAQEKKKAEEDLVRASAFSYYAGNVLGDADTCLGAARSPLYVLKDGAVTTRDEKATRALLTGVADHLKAANLTDDDRKRITGNMLAVFDEASIQFVGANTATCTFLVRRGAKESDGDSLATLVLHRADGRWRVIEEITDSSPVPPGYLLDIPKKQP